MSKAKPTLFTVQRIKESLEKEVSDGKDRLNSEACKDMLQQLDKCTVNVGVLAKTLTGAAVSKLKKHEELGPMAKGLINKWKNVAIEGEAKEGEAKKKEEEEAKISRHSFSSLSISRLSFNSLSENWGDHSIDNIDASKLDSKVLASRCKKQAQSANRPSSNNVEFFSTPLQVLLGIVALLDFLSTLANRRLYNDSKEDGQPEAHFRIFSQDFALPHQIITRIFLWLDAYSVHFGFLFSVLWCIEAFMIAERNAGRDLSEWDRRDRMIGLRTALNQYRPPWKQRPSNYESTDYVRAKTYIVYWASLILQFLLLPVGFYLIVFRFAKMKAISSDVAASFLNPEEMKALLESTFEYVDMPGEYRTFSNETKLSLGFAIAKHSGSAVYKAANSRMKREMWKVGWLEGRKLGWSLVRRPFQFIRNTREMLYWVRWFKYLVPLVRSLNKMRPNLEHLIKTWKQNRERKIARSRRRRAWKKMNEKQKKERAAKTIQSTYRSFQQRKACLEIMTSRREIDDRAARRLQFALRVLLDKAKAREMGKKAELAKLEARQKKEILRRGRRDTTMHPKDKDRLGVLRKQFSACKTRSIDSRLLMKPDTKFQYFWKAIFIYVIVLEMIGYGLNQRLAKHHSSVEKELRDMLIPVRVIDRKECSCLSKSRGDPLKWEHLRYGSKKWQKKCMAEPWYCHPLYLHMQSIYTSLILFLVYHFKGTKALVTLLDVPVFFYTGNYHPETGVLVPKPFIQRWLLPGLFLQLLVNPQLETSSKVVFKILRSSFKIGPVRALRWARALFYPAMVLTLDFIEWSLWMPIVSFSNRNPPPPPEQALLMRRRSSTDPKRLSIFSANSSAVPGPQTSRLSFTSSNRNLSVSFAPLAVDMDNSLRTSGKKYL